MQEKIGIQAKQKNDTSTKKINSTSFDFIDIDNRLQELLELEKKLLAELKSYEFKENLN